MASMFRISPLIQVRIQLVNSFTLETYLIIKKSHNVCLKPKGEICNRLKAGTKVYPIQTKGQWTQITWRNGKKKGWIQFPQDYTQI